MNVMADK